MRHTEDMREASAFRRQKPLVLEVRDELERMILGGEVEGGERLNEANLAELMGVSRAPVREAARSLERDGLVTTIANQGVFVSKLTPDDALELYDLRAMIAGYLCARVAERANDETLAALRAHVTRMSEAIEANDEDAYFEENLAFHDHIAEAADCRRSTTLYIALCKEARLMRMRVLNGREALLISNAEHDRIVSAIENRDAKAAQFEGSQHHLNGKKRLLETL